MLSIAYMSSAKTNPKYANVQEDMRQLDATSIIYFENVLGRYQCSTELLYATANTPLMLGLAVLAEPGCKTDFLVNHSFFFFFGFAVVCLWQRYICMSHAYRLVKVRHFEYVSFMYVALFSLEEKNLYIFTMCNRYLLYVKYIYMIM